MSDDEEVAKIRNQAATGMKKEVDEVKLAIKFAKTIKYVKITLAFLLIGVYFYKPQYLTKLFITGLFVSLLLPQGFNNGYIFGKVNCFASSRDR